MPPPRGKNNCLQRTNATEEFRTHISFDLLNSNSLKIDLATKCIHSFIFLTVTTFTVSPYPCLVPWISSVYPRSLYTARLITAGLGG